MWCKILSGQTASKLTLLSCFCILSGLTPDAVFYQEMLWRWWPCAASVCSVQWSRNIMSNYRQFKVTTFINKIVTSMTINIQQPITLCNTCLLYFTDTRRGQHLSTWTMTSGQMPSRKYTNILQITTGATKTWRKALGNKGLIINAINDSIWDSSPTRLFGTSIYHWLNLNIMRF